LVDQGHAENRAGPTLTDIGVLGEHGLGRGVVENHALPGAYDKLQDRLRQHGLAHDLVAQMHDHGIAACRCFRLYPLLEPPWKNEQTPHRACLLDRGAHQRVDEFFNDYLSRDGLRHPQHRREI
jgi:hypothetical protein